MARAPLYRLGSVPGASWEEREAGIRAFIFISVGAPASPPPPPSPHRGPLLCSLSHRPPCRHALTVP